MRQRKLAWADEFLENSPLLIKDYPIKLSKNSKNELEIGCGKGNFITKKALNNQTINYYAIEIQKSCLAIAIKKATDLEIENIKFCYFNAKDLLDHFTGKFDTIYLNFSDPWPKARHEKRRLTSPNYLKIYNLLLNKDGRIIFKSDNDSLYEYSSTTLPMDFDIISNEENYELTENEIISEYEEKFRKQGNHIHRIIAKRR